METGILVAHWSQISASDSSATLKGVAKKWIHFPDYIPPADVKEVTNPHELLYVKYE